ncbi:MAG: hypothetical protein K6G51_01025 [Sphaerochaetaceae bacterium]|nr:hypothetical protein [Sphaerochaetaceae bacterium]
MVEGELLGLILSLVFLVAIIALGFLAKLSGRFSPESVRKIIHIGVSNWILISAKYLSTFWVTLLGPILFTLLNTLFVYSGASKVLGMGDRKRDNGLIYFPISIIVLYLLKYSNVIALEDVVLGVLVMGYGDGLAALIGKKFGSHKFSLMKANKSVEGCLVMFVVTCILTLVIKNTELSKVLIIAIVATLLEAITPLGFDNITVPIITGLLGGLIC